MKSSRQDLQFGVRMLRKQPGFTLLATLTLALGIGANTAIFSVVNGVLLKPLPYPDPDRLVMLWERNPQKGMAQELVTPPNFDDWQAQQSVFEHLAFWTSNTDFNLVQAEGTEKIRASYVSSELFPALGVQPLQGRGFLPEEDHQGSSRVAVISYDFWQRRLGGTAEVFGQTVTLDTFGKREYTIVGVMPLGFQFPGKSEIWLPAGWNAIGRDRRGVHWLSVLARLKAGVTLERARAEMNSIQSRIEAQFPNLNLGSEVSIVPLLEQTVGQKLQTALWILWGVIGAVLLIACANVANLTLARASARQREIVIRLALGASRWQVVRQLLTESSLLALAGGFCGLLLAVAGIAALKTITADQVPRLQDVRLDRWALGFTLLVSLVTSVLCGLAPALEATKQNLNEALKQGTTATTGSRRNRLRSGLVIAEVALSLLLLIAAGLMLKSFARLASLDRGFRADHLLVAKLDFSISGYTTWMRATTTRPQVTLRALIERLQTHDGVQSVAAVSALSRSEEPPRQGMVLERGQPTETPRANFMGITPDYFRAMGIELLSGRSFSEHDAFEAPSVVIINQTLARRYYPNDDPVGKRLAMEGRTPGQPVGPRPAPASPWSEIVGVVSDTRKLNLSAETVPEVYVPYWQYPMQTPELLVRTDVPLAGALATLRNEIKTLDTNIPAPDIQTMDAMLADVVAQPRFQTTLLTLFGFVALLLSAVGIYSVVAYSVTQRAHEIGIRIALGAGPKDVIKLVVGRGMLLVLVGLVIGISSAFALTSLMSVLLFAVSPTDPLTFAGIPILLVGVALVACLVPARRATRVDPMIALRSE
ncbi:MAG TPA: ABC transporter permease [Blastocatellia bacterium]|nr:ABC transporter permease [Blastocatellia bacterium]